MDAFNIPPDSAALPQNISLPPVFMQDSSAAGPPFLHEYAIHEMNTMLWALLIVVTGVLLKRVAQLLWLWIMGSRLPGPPSPAFTGHASCIAKAGGPDGFTAFLSKLHKEYGSVVRLWLGPTQLLVSVKDQSLIEELLVRAKDRVPSTGKSLHLAFGRSSLFSASFTKAKKRRLLFHEEFNGKVIGRVHTICQKVIGQLQKWAREGTTGCEFDCKSVSQHLTFSVLGTTLFGDSFLTWSAADEFEKLLLLIAKEACFWATYTITPFWNKKFQRYRNNCLKLQILTEEIIAKCRRQQDQTLAQRHSSMPCSKSCLDTSSLGIAAGYEGTGRDLSEDIISGLLSSREWSRPFNSREELRGSLIGMMFHGSLTTAGILSGALTRLAQYPAIQAKVHAEIDDICGKRCPPTADDVRNMHYLMATLHESARLLPTGPLLQRCSLLYDLRLSQRLTVPAGAILAVPVQLVQTDKYSWGQDADVFNPDRFLRRNSLTKAQDGLCWETKFPMKVQMNKSNSDILKRGETGESEEKVESADDENNVGAGVSDQLTFKDPSGNPSFLLFGAGSRSCVGRTFSLNEMTTLLATLLQGFKIKFGPGGGEDLEPKIENCILHLSPSPKLILEPRHCH